MENENEHITNEVQPDHRLSPEEYDLMNAEQQELYLRSVVEQCVAQGSVVPPEIAEELRFSEQQVALYRYVLSFPPEERLEVATSIEEKGPPDDYYKKIIPSGDTFAPGSASVQ